MKRTASLFLTVAAASMLGACSAAVVEPEPSAVSVSLPCEGGEAVSDCTERLTGVVLDSMDDFEALASPSPEQSEAYTALTSASSTWAADCRHDGVVAVRSLPDVCQDAIKDIADSALTINPAFLD